MKNIIYGVVIMSIVLLLSACGSNSVKDPLVPIEVGPYAFYNATTPLVITKPLDGNDSKDYNISVQLLKNGLVEIGQSLQLKPFDFKYGHVLSSIVDTNENGVGTFVYKAPRSQEYDIIKGGAITLEVIFLDPKIKDDTLSDDSLPPILISQKFDLEFR